MDKVNQTSQQFNATTDTATNDTSDFTKYTDKWMKF